MDRIRKVSRHDKEVIVIDYTNCKDDNMIMIFDEVMSMVLSENRRCFILNVLNSNTFISPKFLRHVEQEAPKYEMLVEKRAVIGISAVQEWILKGINLWSKPKLHKFDSMEEALNFLTND
jgi:hypothetical protein